MEELLNKLIQRWWKPFGKIPVNINQWDITQTYCKYFGKGCIHIHREDDIENEDIRRPRITDELSLRELVSKESWLRQFCCENKLVKEDCSSIELYIISEWYWIMTDSYYQFWLMMCSLKDESELEKFLLDNIKIS